MAWTSGSANTYPSPVSRAGTAQQSPTSCTLEYRPVVARAHGSWHGKPVHWTQEFGNDCALRSATGAVFRF